MLVFMRLNGRQSDKFSEDGNDIESKVLTMPNRHAEADTRNDPSVWIRTFIYTAERWTALGGEGRKIRRLS